MYDRLLVEFGVPASAVRRYGARVDKSYAGIKHAHLLGVIDPTGMLPSGHIFITGYVGGADEEKEERHVFGAIHNEVFVTRSPCLEPSDAKLLPVVGSKPTDMTMDAWEFLCSLLFGHIIFAAPKDKDDATLPYLVGEGELVDCQVTYMYRTCMYFSFCLIVI